mgnify:CR=1 FL=1
MNVNVNLMREQMVRARLGGIGRTKFHFMRHAGEFPQPLKIGRTNVWRSDDVDRWIDEQTKLARGRRRPVATLLARPASEGGRDAR